jgi:glycosyltransferase involved in cell wall biosynthesis
MARNGAGDHRAAAIRPVHGLTGVSEPRLHPTIWIDAEDLFRYAEAHTRPSGIQRLALEMCRAMVARHCADGRVRFLRQRSFSEGFYAVSWESLRVAFETMANKPQPAPLPAGPAGLAPLRRFLALQRQAFAALGLLLRRLTREIAEMPATVSPERDPFAAEVRAGDVILALGSPWLPGYAARIRRAREEFQVRFALTIYDIIPLRHPEWCHTTVTDHFGAWIDAVLPLSDHVFAISRATADDLARYAAGRNIPLRRAPLPFPIGTGFHAPPASREAAVPTAPALPPAGSYALFVSTIEPRKNHVLLFRVWQTLLRDLPRDAVPTLVFAGHVGWMVADLIAQLDNCGWLDGKIMFCKHPTDAELEALYRGCRFTLFPSLYEGWGLPVTESLVFGKPCVISSSTSLPEAGGRFARYFDPESVPDAVRVIRGVIEDADGLAAWQAQVAREFRPVPWDESARVMLEALDEAATAAD